MAELNLADFDVFFAEVNRPMSTPSNPEPRRPFAWQRRLCEHLVRTGSWPDVIDAPTGSGKSSVIDIHVFAWALTLGAPAPDTGRRLPRRLVVSVDRRALVDDQHERAQALADRLREAISRPDHAHPVVLEVARRLAARRTRVPQRAPGAPLDAVADDAGSPLEVALIRGGAAPDRAWVDDPTCCQVIAATPDMIGSRLLFSGYGTTRLARPREAGLLAFDTCLVVDEAHLSRQLLTTTRRVSELATAHGEGLTVPAVKVVAMSATTKADGDTVIGVEDPDLDVDELLADRLRRPKPVRLRQVDRWGPTVHQTAQTLAEEALALLAAHGGTVGCIVNTVQGAVEVTESLRKSIVPTDAPSLRAGTAPEVRTLVGRMRPFELHRLREEHPGLFTLDGDPDVDIVVATQTLEVGVDMDFAALVTELSPGTALAQRAGRTNRSGARESGPVVVVVPQDPAALDDRSAPYEAADMAAALEWLNGRAADPDGLAPWRIHPRGGGAAPPAPAPQRGIVQRPEPWDVRAWSRTSDDRYQRPELELWLSDDLRIEPMASVVVRQGMPGDPVQAAGMLAAAPPLAHERFPVRLPDLRALLAALAGIAVPERQLLAFLLRPNDDVRARPDDEQAVTVIGDVASYRPRPEDIVVLDAAAPIARAGVVTQQLARPADDVSERFAGRNGEPFAPGEPRTVRISRGAPVFDGWDPPARANGDSQLLELLERLQDILRSADGEDAGEAAEAQEGPGTEDVRGVLTAWLAQFPNDRPRGSAGRDGSSRDPELPGGRGEQARERLRRLFDDVAAGSLEVVASTGPDVAPEDFWLVLADPGAQRIGEADRQVWNPPAGVPRDTPVTLDDHCSAVGKAAGELSRLLGLSAHLAELLGESGKLHDAGKADRRFQRGLRYRESSHPGVWLAKSAMTSRAAARRARDASGLPTGWRHEQLSAAIAWEATARYEASDRDLIVRLVGTSHGHGRSGFPHSAQGLLCDEEHRAPAVLLFDEDEWDLLIERTEADWGPWGCAYLEALLRAADVTVSWRGSWQN